MLKIPIILAADNNYAPYMSVLMISILKNAKSNSFFDFYLLVPGNFKVKNKQKIEEDCKFYENKQITFVNMESSFSKTRKVIDHITEQTYYRLKAADILPVKYDKCIYLDVDTIVNTDLNELLSIDIDDNYIAAVRAAGYYFKKDWAKKYCLKIGIPDISQYVNAGVLLMNLRKIREDNLTPILEKEAYNNYPTVDQDVFNKVCYNHILHLPFKFNVMTKYKSIKDKTLSEYKQMCEIYGEKELNEAIERPLIIHYADKIKPWNDKKCIFSDYWWKYARKSVFYRLIVIIYIKTLYNKEWKLWIQKVFSIRNENNHKIITLAGIKFKKKINRNKKSNTFIKIFVAYHKKDKLYKNKVLIPIHVGRAISTQQHKDGQNANSENKWLYSHMIGDDTGDNISEKNRYLNELTGIYWVWKNYDKIGNPEYIGFAHYRRLFANLIKKKDFKDIFKTHDLITLYPMTNKGKTIVQYWTDEKNCTKYNVTINDFDLILNILKEQNKDEALAFENYINTETYLYFKNMFVLKKEEFFKYCKWIFPIISELEKYLDTNSRKIGYLAERLTSFYIDNLIKNGAKPYYADFTENIFVENTLQKIFSVRNNYQKTHKIITILGIRIKVKLKRKSTEPTVKEIRYLSNLNNKPIVIEHCPLCGSKHYIVAKDYSINSLIERWIKQYSFVPFAKCYENKILERRVCLNCHMNYYNFEVPDTAEFYNKLGTLHNLYSKDKWDYDEALKIVEEYKPKSLMDIGCGYGYFIEKIQNAVEHVVGSEFNPAAIDICKNKGIKLYTTNLKEVSKKFDMITAFQVFEHVKDNKTFIEDCLNILKPNGLLLLVTPNPNSELIKYTPGILELPPHHCCDISKETYEYIAKKYNLEIIDYKQQEIELWVYKAYLKGKYSLEFTSNKEAYINYLQEKNNLTGKSHLVLFKNNNINN